ncbi:MULTISPECIES: cold-shock protein [Shinella]|uniref:Cold-shock protein n=1 Tax=Shinella lacus TaxID=2654216 RepID=A0ABT1R2L4_9HYPH|nr:cold-shock protein [Shinella lacus]MCQ4629393.1 cold-shock protein [Shinella lacus]
MSRKRFAIGDTVTLKADLFRSADSERVCRVVGVLPSDHGEAQYRVRLGNETCERRIVASDIEATDTVEIRSGGSASASSKGSEPWFKPSSIRVNK